MIELVVVNLKAKLQPMHRHELEDEFLDICEQENLPLDIVGGGTLMDSDNSLLECDIEIKANEGYELTQNILSKIAEIFQSLLAPKGSSLLIYETDKEEPTKIEIGTMEGLSLTLNGTELPKEVYETSDINVVLEECEKRLATIGRFYSYEENTNMMLYFYGKSFNEMKQAILPFVETYPLCQKSVIEQIA